MSDLPEHIENRPNLCGSEALIESALRASRERPVFLPESRINFG